VRVPRELIKYYFDYAVSDYLDENQDIPSDMSELDEYMPNLKATLMNNHEQLSFALGLKLLLEDPDVDLQEFYGYNFPLEDEEIRAVMDYLLKVVLPNKSIGHESVVITKDSIEDNRIERGLLYKINSEQTLETVAQKCGLTLDFIRKANPYWYETLGYSCPIEVGRTVKLKLADDWH
jgi:hypothetical protein